MFDQTQSEILDGLLLGDAYIPRDQNLFYFGQRKDSREYVEFVARQLGIPESRVQDRARKPDRRTGRVYHCSELRTFSDPYFARQRERWYRERRKVVPGDLRISRPLLLHWFLCDGSCSVNRGGAQMVLCTDGFDKEEVLGLQSLMESVGIESRPVGRRLRVRQKSIARFYEYVGPCPVNCLAYKWIPEENRRSRQTDLTPRYAEIRSLYRDDGWSCEAIARKYGTNYFSIRYVLKKLLGTGFGKNPAAETTCREGVVTPSETARRAPENCG